MAAQRVLITASRTPAALELVRAFGRSGSQVYTADSYRATLGGFSRYVDDHFLLPRAAQDPEAYRRRIALLHQQFNFDLIIPTAEETFHLAGCNAPIFCVPLSLLKRLHSKILFLELAQASGFSIPETHWIETSESFSDDPSNWVFKREFCRFGSGTVVGEVPNQHGPWLVQQRLHGRELSCYSVGVKGEMTAFCIYEPLHRLPASSGLILKQVFHKAARDAMEKFHQQLNYTGQLSLDLIETPGGLFAVDCNPRATSGIHFFDGAPGFAQSFSPTVEVRTGSGGIRSFGPALPMLLPSIRSKKQFQSLFRDWWKSKEAGWSLSDPLPHLGLLLQTLETILRGAKDGVGFQVASTRDLEWDGQGDHFTLGLSPSTAKPTSV